MDGATTDELEIPPQPTQLRAWLKDSFTPAAGAKLDSMIQDRFSEFKLTGKGLRGLVGVIAAVVETQKEGLETRGAVEALRGLLELAKKPTATGEAVRWRLGNGLLRRIEGKPLVAEAVAETVEGSSYAEFCRLAGVLGGLNQPKVIAAADAKFAEAARDFEALPAVPAGVASLISEVALREHFLEASARAVRRSAANFTRVAALLESAAPGAARLSAALTPALLEAAGRAEGGLRRLAVASTAAIPLNLKTEEAPQGLAGFIDALGAKIVAAKDADAAAEFCGFAAKRAVIFEGQGFEAAARRFVECFALVRDKKSSDAVLRALARLTVSPAASALFAGATESPLLAVAASLQAIKTAEVKSKIKDQGFHPPLSEDPELKPLVTLTSSLSQFLSSKLAPKASISIPELSRFVCSFFLAAKFGGADGRKLAGSAVRLLCYDPFTRKTLTTEYLSPVENWMILAALEEVSDAAEEFFSSRVAETATFSLFSALLLLSCDSVDWRGLTGFQLRAGLKGLTLLGLSGVKDEKLKREKIPAALGAIVGCKNLVLGDGDSTLLKRTLAAAPAAALAAGGPGLAARSAARKAETSESNWDFVLFAPGPEPLAVAALFDSELLDRLWLFFDKTIVQSLDAKQRVQHLAEKRAESPVSTWIERAELDALDRFGFTVPQAPKETKGSKAPQAPQTSKGAQASKGGKAPQAPVADSEDDSDSDSGEDALTLASELVSEAGSEDPEERKIKEISLLRSRPRIDVFYASLLDKLVSAFELILRHAATCPTASITASLRRAFDAAAASLLSPGEEFATQLGRVYRALFAFIFREPGIDPRVFAGLALRVHLADLSAATVSDFERFATKLEFSIDAPAKPQEASADSPNLAAVWAEFLGYAVSARCDPAVKRKFFGLAHRAALGGGEFKFFCLVCEKINDLFFPEVSTTLTELASILAPLRPDVLDSALSGFLIFEDFALKVVLKVTNQLCESGVFDSQIVGPPQKLKALIVCENEDAEIAELAATLVRRRPLRFDATQPPKLAQLAKGFPADLLGSIALAFEKTFSLMSPEESEQFTKLMLDEFETEMKGKQPHLEVFLAAVLAAASAIPAGQKPRALKLVFAAEAAGPVSAPPPRVAAAARKLVSIAPGQAKEFVALARAALAGSKPALAPILALGECAAVSDSGEGKALGGGEVQSSLEALLETTDADFHLALALNLRPLVSFFSDPLNRASALLTSAREAAAPSARVRCLFAAGLLRSLGIRTVSELQIIENVQSLVAGAKRGLRDVSPSLRFYAVAVMESLWRVFGRLLEPRAKEIVETLLPFAGDPLEDVRNSAKRTVDLMMQELSEYSIGQIIPVLVKGCSDKNSKTKLNSLLFLGAVSKCGVRQLATHLPGVIPVLTGISNDPDIDVRTAAVKSLSQILSTIKNPEITLIRDQIIEALADPFARNNTGLDSLLHTTFRHYIDAASLSLVLPIVFYGLRPASDDASKEKACKVVASLTSMVQREEDLLPHVEPLVDALFIPLKEVLPELRASASKAFRAVGSRFKGRIARSVIARLRAVLESPLAQSIEKAGAAQAFAEMIYMLEGAQREETLLSVLALTTDAREPIKESFLSVMVYVPIVFGEEFEKYVFPTIENVIDSIGHEKERIRNLAIKSMKIIVQMFLEKNVGYVIEPFIQGAFSPNPARRHSSLLLIGDIVEFLHQKIEGADIYSRYPALFVALYITKNDSDGDVRIISSNIFKTYISNVQKCLRRIHPDLIELILSLLDKDNDFLHGMASNGLKEFTQKYGDTFLREVFAILEKKSSEAPTKLSPLIFADLYLQFFSKNLLSPERKAVFRGFLDARVEDPVRAIRLQALRTLRTLVDVSGDWRPAGTQATHAARRLDQMSSEDPEAEVLVDLLVEYSESKSEKLADTILRESLSSSPLQIWQLDFIARKLDFYSEMMYRSPELEKGILFFVRQVEKGVEPRTRSLLVETTAALAARASGLQRRKVVEDFESSLRAAIKSDDHLQIGNVLSMISGFLEKSSPEAIVEAASLVMMSVPLIAYKGPEAATLFEQLGRLLSYSFDFVPEENCGKFIHDLLFNLKSTVTDKKSFEGVRNEQVLSSLFGLCFKVLANCSSETSLLALKVIKFIAITMDKSLFSSHVDKIYCSLIRVMLNGLCTETLTLKSLALIELLLEKNIFCKSFSFFFSQFVIFKLSRGEKNTEIEQKMFHIVRQISAKENVGPFLEQYWKTRAEVENLGLEAYDKYLKGPEPLKTD